MSVSTRFSMISGESSTKISGANEDSEIFFCPCSADHEEDWQPYPVDPYSAIICDEHTYNLRRTTATIEINNYNNDVSPGMFGHPYRGCTWYIPVPVLTPYILWEGRAQR